MNTTGGHNSPDNSDKGNKTSEPGVEVMQHLLQSASLPLVAINLQGRLEYHAVHVPEVLGAKSQDLNSLNVLKVLSERDQSILKAHLDRVIIDKQPARCEVEIKVLDGQKQWIRFVSHHGVDENGAVLCWSTLENLTQLRRLEKIEALYQRSSEIVRKSETLKEFSEKIFDLLKILFGIENGYVALHDARHDVLSFPYFTDRRDPPPASRGMAEGLTDYVITTARFFWLKDEQSISPFSDGSVHVMGSLPTDWIGVPLTYNGKVVGMTAIQMYEENASFTSKDVGLMLGVANLFELYIGRIEMEQSRNLLTQAVEHADESIVITDLRGIIEYVNTAFEKKTGFTRAQAIGQSLALINSGTHDESFFKEMWNDISNGKTWRGRFTNRKKDGTLYEEDVVITPIMNKEGQIVNYVGLKRDLTRETEAEHGSMSAHRIEIIERLVEGINHDFSNTLMTVRASAEDIKKEGASAVSGSEADQIIEAVSRAEELVDTLSQLFSHEHERSGLVRLNELLLQFEPTAKRLVGERIKLRFELAPRMEPVRISWREVEQVLFSLLSRAVESMPQDEEIELRTLVAPARQDDAFHFIGDAPSGKRKCVVIEVTDRGASVAREDWKSLFTADKEKASIGMETVRQLIKKQHGCIGIKENVPSGMIFRLYFPVVSSDGHAPVALGKQQPVLPQGSETILLAEDDDGARRVIARMLQDQGYAVIEAENGAMAIRALLEQKDHIDLLITDMMMPDFDGGALSEQTHALKPDLKVIFVSGYSRSDLEAEGVLEKGSDASLLKKPFKREELLQLVRQTLDG